MASIESVLETIKSECTSSKYASLKDVTEKALSVFPSEGQGEHDVYKMRDCVLEPLQAALESCNTKLSNAAIAGLHCVMEDERFHCSLESESEDQWLPQQILNTVWSCPTFSEELQVEVMKILLKLGLNVSWGMTATTVMKICQLCVNTFLHVSSSRFNMAQTALNSIGHAVSEAFGNSNSEKHPNLSVINTKNGGNREPPDKNETTKKSFLRKRSSGQTGSKMCLDVFGTSGSSDVKMAARVTMTQILKAVVEKFRESVDHESFSDDEEGPNNPEENTPTKCTDPEVDIIMSDFSSFNTKEDLSSMERDILDIFEHFCNKLTIAHSLNQNRLAIPLYLDGILAILEQLPATFARNKEFLDLLWKTLCPTMVSLMGNPKSDKKTYNAQKSLSQDGELGRGSGASSSAPSVSKDAARAIYGISVQLVLLVGNVRSMRPVLESLFHRILLYPPPQHRKSVLKCMKELLTSSSRLLKLAGPCIQDSNDKGHHVENQSLTSSNIRLLKIILDSIQECCHCQETNLSILGVQCVHLLLSSIDELTEGQSINNKMARLITNQFQDSDLDKESRLIRTSLALSSCSSSHQPAPSSSSPPGSIRHSGSNQSVATNSSTVHPSLVSEASRGEENLNWPSVSMHNDNVSIFSHEETDNHAALRGRRHLEEEYQTQIAQTSFANLERTERQCARDYILVLLQLVPSLFEVPSGAQVDDALMTFASNFCTAICVLGKQEVASEHTSTIDEHHSTEPVAILNADAVYVTTYAALLLNLKLINSDYYSTLSLSSLVITEKQFCESVLGCGLLLYLSESWLSEVYRLVVEKNYLGIGGYRTDIHSDCALVSVLTDIDGLGARIQGGQFLSEHRLSEAPIVSSDPECSRDPKVCAGRNLSKCLMIVCWEGILDILSVMLSGRGVGDNFVSQLALLLGTEGALEEGRMSREAVILSLEGLQSAARLASLLGLQNRCGAVFQQLASASSQMDTTSGPNMTSGGSGSSGAKSSTAQHPDNHPTDQRSTKVSSKTHQIRLHASHALSLDMILSRGLEMGSYAPDCWPHIFHACCYISRLEYLHFSHSATSATSSTTSSTPLTAALNTKSFLTGSQLVKRDQGDYLDLGTVTNSDFMDTGCHTSFPASSGPFMTSQEPTIASIITDSASESGWESRASGILTTGQTRRVLCGLSQLIDTLFEDAASKLNLESLVLFIKSLCRASVNQLMEKSNFLSKGTHQTVPSCATPPVFLIDRVCEVMLKCIRSERPLYHLLRLWSVVSSHLTEACCHKDPHVSRRAVSSLHECIIATLSNRLEKTHFHVNESLCRPIENLLRQELCDGDVQDQLVCCICELVEACSTEIRSGWRPLFGALRAIKIEFTASEELNEARQRHVNAVLDVFQAFLSTDNVLVFTNAAVDCILCLLKYLKGSVELTKEDSDCASDDSDDFVDIVNVGLGTINPEESSDNMMPGVPCNSDSLCLPALRYLQRCCQLLASMWLMSACPKFKSSHKIRMSVRPSKVKPYQPDVDITYFLNHFSNTHIHLSEETVKNLSSTSATDHEDSNKDSENIMDCLDELDKSCGILHVWFMLLDGLAKSVSTCPPQTQATVLYSLFDLVRSTLDCPGPHVTLILTNHILLPQLQRWLAERRVIDTRVNRIASRSSSIKHRRLVKCSETNIRQAFGLSTDLIGDLIVQLSNNSDLLPELCDMLEHKLEVLIECIAQPMEVISRLGSSCIRHILTSAGPLMNEPLWEVACRLLKKAIDVSMYPLILLMTPFHINSDQFYGDSGQVKVAARHDGCNIDCERLRQLAQKVFLLESQHSQPDCSWKERKACDSGSASRSQPVIDYTVEEMRNYVFLLYPSSGVENNTENTLARIQFRGIVYGLLAHQLLLQSIGDLLLSGSQIVARSDRHLIVDRLPQSESADNELPGVMGHLSVKSCLQLLHCLALSYRFCSEFDRRPGLKFLIQRVSHSKVAANLYKQAGVAAAFLQHTMVEIVRHADLSLAVTKEALSQSKELFSADFTDELELTSDWREQISRENLNDASDLSVIARWKVFLCLLARSFASLTHVYLSMLTDKISLEMSDRLSEKPLFLLVAQPEELSDSSWVKQESQRTQKSLGIQLMTLSEQSKESKRESNDNSNEEEKSPSKSTKSSTRDKVYTIASERTIRNVMAEYKKHKLQNSLPPANRRFQHYPASTTKNNTDASSPEGETVPPGNYSIDAEVHKEKVESLIRDSTARLLSTAQMLTTPLQLAVQLPDDQFESLIPALSPSIILLIGLAEDATLRELLSAWVSRISQLYDFAPTSTHPEAN